MPQKPLKAAISVAEMCRMLEISRSQYHWHVERGTFHPPLYLVRNRRPYFTAEMAQENLDAKESGIGVNGDYVIFYAKRSPSSADNPRGTKHNHTKLIASLKSLGLEKVTTERVEAAIATCFPQGTSGQEDSHVLRTIFRHLKRSESA